MMGLDMYAYAVLAERIGDELINPALPDTDVDHDFAYWRKFHDLHHWMLGLYKERGGTGMFNGDTLRLRAADLDRLEQDMATWEEDEWDKDSGHFDDTRAFITKARSAIDDGLAVLYDSCW